MIKLKKVLNESALPKFISDNEKNIDLFNDDGSKYMTLDRYAVWGNKGKNKHEVIETSNDLNYLMKKYNIPENMILKMK